MLPARRLTSGGVVVPWMDRLASLRLTLSLDSTSDYLEAVFDDGDHQLAIPRAGGELDAWLGYGEDLRLMGRFRYADVDIQIVPAQIVLRASAADFGADAPIRAPRTTEWEEPLNLAALVSRVAQRHGYQARVADALAAADVGRIDQQEESDLALLQRVARDHDAAVVTHHTTLAVVPAGTGESVSGKPLVVTVRPPDVTTGRVSLRERNRYAAVSARWRDMDAGETMRATAGGGTPVLDLVEVHADQAAAQRAANATLARIRRGDADLQLTIEGNPSAVAGARLRMVDFRPGINGEYVVNRADHTSDGSGYRTEIQATAPSPGSSG